ncbi:MAG: hypothetical protein LBP86_02465 [Azoarcus sp.]|jgi:predicted exporter|nr:hypothetical protein [Azoarcus sp.]
MAPVHRLLAGGWLVCLLAAGAILLLGEARWAGRIDTDLLALMPRDERRPVHEAALKALAARGERQLAVLVSAHEAAATHEAAVLARAALADSGLVERRGDTGSLADFYLPWRHGLLSAADLDWLRTATPEAAHARALGLAHAPFAPGALSWQSDPFGFFGNWLASLAETTPLRIVGDELGVTHENRHYAALVYTLPHSAFAADFQQTLVARLDEARARVRDFDPDARFLAVGVVLHAAAATRQAESEMRLIGMGSLLGTFFLIGFVFQSARALQLIAVSLLSGATAALFAAVALFERVHAVTLVFGASLIGVAVDYAILVFAQHLGSAEPVRERFRRLLPTLCMVLVTPALAYFALALTPFPGLEQMAVFAVCGIFGAWTSVVLFYPYLLPGTLPLPRNADAMARLVGGWPRWRNSAGAWGIALLLAAVAAGGLARLRVDDDIRGLFSGDPALMAEQRDAEKIMRLPSPAQMFLVSGLTPEALLRNEEALIERLRPFVAAGGLGGYEAVSRWLPSGARQREALALQGRLRPSLACIADELELPAAWVAASSPDSPGKALTPEIWLADAASEPFRPLWLGASEAGGAMRHFSMVLLQGLADRATASALAELPGQAPMLAGVEWIDQTREISALMARYRGLLTRTLLLACLAVPLLLFPFFKGRVWRIVAPVLAAGGMTLALMGYLDIPLQLLSLLALLLTLGMGVDYAIFLQSRQSHAHTLLATTLAALLTLLSFGLLALSGTPALRALGLTAALGVMFSWMLTPVFLQKAERS